MSAARSLAGLTAYTLLAGVCPWAMGTLTGQWVGPYVLQPAGKLEATMAVHSILLHDGRVLCIDETRSPSPNSADVVVVDPDIPPTDGIQVALDEWDETQQLLFCSGHAHLRDGKIVFLGGGTGCAQGALVEPRSTFYIPDLAGGPGTWLSGPDERWCPSDNRNCQPGQEAFTHRWYPTVTALTSRMLGTDGQCDNRPDVGEPNIPVLLNLNAAEPQFSSWLPLYDAGYPNGEQNVNLYFYPFMFLLSNGQVLMCGARAPDNPAQMRIARKLDVALGVWIPQAQFRLPASITGISACMYQKDKVFKVGEIVVTGERCSDPNRCSGSKAAAYLDLNFVPPVWASAGEMREFRCHFYVVPTPDGRVHIVGGPGNTAGNPNAPPEV